LDISAGPGVPRYATADGAILPTYPRRFEEKALPWAGGLLLLGQRVVAYI